MNNSPSNNSEGDKSAQSFAVIMTSKGKWKKTIANCHKISMFSKSFVECGRIKFGATIIIVVSLALIQSTHMESPFVEATDNTSPQQQPIATSILLPNQPNKIESSINQATILNKDVNNRSSSSASTEEADSSSKFDVELSVRQKTLTNITSSVANLTVQHQIESSPMQAQAIPKIAPVLRPSIEEVASELSRKHLNLEHENWRLKQPPSVQSGSSPMKQEIGQRNHQEVQVTPGKTIDSGANDDTARDFSTEANVNEDEKYTVEAEQDIKVSSLLRDAIKSTGELTNGTLHQVANDSQVQEQRESFLRKTNDRNRDYYLQIEPTSANIRSNQANHPSQTNKPQSSHRRKKGNNLLQNNHHHYDGNDLIHCQQYLQHHNTALGPSLTSASSQVAPSHQLPCSCEPRKHFNSAESPQNRAAEGVWLSCDNVQLIGSHFYTPSSSPFSGNVNFNDKNHNDSSDSSSINSGDNDAHEGTKQLIVTKFSQRESGLQTLHSQKFYYLQLFHLRSIDLSNNRIRQIKMDAFHGLENKLEHLNLGNNLLGDSRAIFDSAQNLNAYKSIINQGKLILFNDELNRLKKLTWLSLRNNQVSQLGSSIFIKQQPPLPSSTGSLPTPLQDTSSTLSSSSELSYLDLSENLLISVPSESIHLLNKLKTLNLRRNRIAQLDQFSKFPHSLKYLDLSENLIRIVRQCDLIDLPDLIELNLSYNQLSHLDKTAFVSSLSSLGSPLTHNNLILSQAFEKSSAASEVDQLSPEPVQVDAQTNLFSGDTKDRLDSHNYHQPPELIIKDLADGLSDSNQDTGDKSGAILRRQRDVKEDMEIEGSSSSIIDNNSEPVEGDLDADESILSSLTNLVNRQAVSDELNYVQQMNQFNSTAYLNLSHNFLENLPGDSLLKFSNLKQLDLSFNRIRRIDSNYICSIYNLVENLNQLDLSGNLLTMTSQNISSGDGGSSRQLNKLFGCLLKLEKLSLSMNRLVAAEQKQSPFDAPDLAGVQSISSLKGGDDDDDAQLRDTETTVGFKEAAIQPFDKLTIRFGESHGNKYLNTLDLSDNQLRSMPIIEQVNQQPLVLSRQSNSTNITNYQSQLNQWMNSCVHLEVLNLNFNYLERFEEHEFEYLYNLRQLNFDFNKLTLLPVKIMRKFNRLDRLSANGNRISSLAPMNELFERSVRTLRVLNLANNRLLEWPQINKQIMIKEAIASSAFHQEPSDSDGSEDKQALVFALEELNLEGNLLTSGNVTSLFDQLIHMRSLKILNLSYNLLNRIKSEWFKFSNRNLQKLLLSGNKINSIDLGSFSSNQVNELLQLNLDYNLLKELKRKTFDSLPRIQELNLAYNLIHTINSETFHQINSLQILKLNNNKLTSWKCEYFSNLCNSISGNINADIATLLSSSLHNHQDDLPVPPTVSSLYELDLSHNSISQLRANSISAHTKLVKLDLSHNKLSFIPHDLFRATTSSAKIGQIQLVSSLRYLNLAYNRIQTIDNINFRPLKNLLSLDLSFNELQTLGNDVVVIDPRNANNEHNNRKLIVSNNITNLLVVDEMLNLNQSTGDSQIFQLASNWPALSRLRHFNVANNQLTVVNQSMLSELSPFALLKLNLSNNFLESEALPAGFYAKTSTSSNNNKNAQQDTRQTNYDLVFTLKLESLDLSHNRLNEFPSSLLDNHYTSMELCDLSHNRIQTLTANSNLMIQIKHLNLEHNPLNRESSELILYEQRSARHLNLAATRLYAIQQATVMADQLSHGSTNGFQLSYRIANQTSQLDLIRSISKPIEAPYLRHLNLSSNQLVWLAANVFDRMHSLQTLDLSNNQLTRLHLLNNQLSHISSTLEYLSMSSNLFTNIDSTDFSQLSKLRYLDISNLLSLQKINCKFLSKLTTLKAIKMFNYPQMRSSLNAILMTLNSNAMRSQPSERLQRKLRQELVLSTIGKHCFQDEPATDTSHDGSSSVYPRQVELKWFDLEELELELFNNHNHDRNGDGFILENELSQLLGPQTKKVTLIGLNLTSIADDSLLGITNEELTLKISYTSMFQLPLKQILSSVTKRTRLNLDFRHNNVQSIDMKNLQLLDELQLNNQVLQRGDHSSLALSWNPIKCDCQTRPLWLWLNQRWGSVDITQSGDEQITDTNSINNANYWLKFNSIFQTSDLRCHSPLKLRGKLTQHVHYNDLVCKGSQSGVSSLGRQSRKKNETNRLGESYLVSGMNSGVDPIDSDDLDEDDYIEFDAQKGDGNLVKVTKFNRYPVNRLNNTVLLLDRTPVPFSQGRNEMFSKDFDDEPSRIGKRDSSNVSNSNSMLDNHNNQQINTKYSKHRPNTQQKHSHFNTLAAFNQLHLSKNLYSRNGGSNTKYSLLTESDVLILTITSVAMIIMFFVIITICLFKRKMDKSDKEHILNAHNGVMISQAHLADCVTKKSLNQRLSGNHSTASKQNSQSSKSSSSSSSDMSSKQSKKTSTSVSSSKTANKLLISGGKSVKLATTKGHIAQSFVPVSNNIEQVLVPMRAGGAVLAPAAQNFLMRSPTIRRMHGLATNASDWFKFTLRAYPTVESGRQRRLFISNNVSNGYHAPSGALSSKPDMFPSTVLATGCPIHAFKCIRKLKNPLRWRSSAPLQPISESCLYCARLLASLQQTKVQHLVRPRQEVGVTTSGGITSNAAESHLEQRSQLDQSPTTRSKDSSGELILVEKVQTDDDSGEKAANDQQPCYITPSLIKALAKQLNDQQNQADRRTSTGSDWRSYQHQSSSGAYHSREQQVKSMKTFGFNNAAQSVGSTLTSLATTTNQQSGDSQLPSQIPGVDINGRFAYQTESQLDSPAYPGGGSLRASREANDTNTPSSLTGGGSDYIFTPAQENGASRLQSGDVTSSRDGSDQVEILAVRNTSPALVGSNEVVNDEYSNSSSPIVAYMRSSPSGTTLSSITQNQYVVNNTLSSDSYSNNRTFMNSGSVARVTNDYGHFNYNNHNSYQIHRDQSENNNTEYSLDRKEEAIALVVDRRNNSTESNNSAHQIIDVDDQIIVSRL